MRLQFAVRRIIEKVRARKKKMEFPLLELPNELIVLVAEAISDFATLGRLACTSRQLQELTEPVLWRQLVLFDSARARQVVAAMNSRSQRAGALVNLTVPCNVHFGRDMGLLATIMQTAKNVASVKIQSPLCGEEEFETQQEWSHMIDQLFLPFQLAAGGLAAERPLQKLRKLTLHLNGPESPYWTPDARSLHIFLSLTLQYLKVSCVNIPADLFEELGTSERHSTPLRKLVLEECNISPQGLHGILALPKALEVLSLGENVFNQRHFDNPISPSFNLLFYLSSHTTIRALRQQKHSLKSLEYKAAHLLLLGGPNLVHVPIRTKEPGLDAGFADFDRLEEIILSGPCAAFERAVMSTVPPPNLRFLRYHSGNPLTLPDHPMTPHIEDVTAQDNYLVSLLPFFRAPSARIPASIEVLDTVYESRLAATGLFTEGKQQSIRNMALALKRKHAATLMVSYTDRGSYYPPLLYGEPRPIQALLYDGEDDEFDGGEVEEDFWDWDSDCE